MAADDSPATDTEADTMPPLNITRTIIRFGPFDVTRQVFQSSPLSFAIVNLKPILPGHVLVVPHRQVARFGDLTSDEVSDLFLTAQKVSKTIARLFHATALNIAIQDGADAGQSVAHVHAHIIPRKKADLDARGGSDAVYEIMDGEEGDIGKHQREAERKRRGAEIKVDADGDRKPRSMDDMVGEAQWLADEMEKDSDA